MKFRCDVCKVYEYDESIGDSKRGIRPGTLPKDFPDEWRCPVCESSRSHLREVRPSTKRKVETSFECPHCGKVNNITLTTGEEDLDEYLGEWRRESDDTEIWMRDIHNMSKTARSVDEPMRTKKAVVSWDDILIMGAQLANLPLNSDEEVSTRTVIGGGAKRPLVLDMPIFVTHMSFGALSREIKLALAKGSAAMRTAIGSGEGGILEDVLESAYRYIFEYVPNRYSVTDENLRRVDAIELKIGQSAKPGIGGHLPAAKVTPEIARVRGSPEGLDILSPARFPDISRKEDLRDLFEELRDRSQGAPVGIKLAAGRIEADLEVAVFAEPDFITIDGRPGATGSAPKFIKDSTSVPTIYALARGRRYLDEIGAGDISLVITGGLRISTDFAKAIAMGADAVAIGTAALMAAACQQYRLCNTGGCPVGVTTQDPDLRSRLSIDLSAKKLENFLRISNEELKDIARLTGHNDIHDLGPEDLCTTNSNIATYTSIRHAGRGPNANSGS